jgi:hypothetical protein
MTDKESVISLSVGGSELFGALPVERAGTLDTDKAIAELEKFTDEPLSSDIARSPTNFTLETIRPTTSSKSRTESPR